MVNFETSTCRTGLVLADTAGPGLQGWNSNGDILLTMTVAGTAEECHITCAVLLVHLLYHSIHHNRSDLQGPTRMHKAT